MERRTKHNYLVTGNIEEMLKDAQHLSRTRTTTVEQIMKKIDTIYYSLHETLKIPVKCLVGSSVYVNACQGEFSNSYKAHYYHPQSTHFEIEFLTQGVKVRAIFREQADDKQYYVHFSDKHYEEISEYLKLNMGKYIANFEDLFC